MAGAPAVVTVLFPLDPYSGCDPPGIGHLCSKFKLLHPEEGKKVLIDR